jgi:signal transduction histidine kinase
VLALIVVLVGVNGLVAVRAAQARNEARAESTELRAVTADANELARELVDLETAQRGYLITAAPRYLTQYADVAKVTDRILAHLDERVAARPALQAPLQDLEEALDRWRTHAEKVEILARGHGLDAAAAAVASGEGSDLFDAARARASELVTTIERLADAARQESQHAYDRFVRVVAITLVGVLTVVVALSVFLSRWITRPVERLASSVERIGTGNLDQQVDVSGPAELVRIGSAVEDMRERLVTQISQTEQAAADLAEANAELETFSYSVSHDLRAPLRAIDGFSRALLEDAGDQLDEVAQGHFARIRAATLRMATLIDDLLQLSRLSRMAPVLGDVDVSANAQSVIDDLRAAEPERAVEVTIQPGLHALADPALANVVLENLLGNAWKFTANEDDARIELVGEGGAPDTIFAVVDNGAGFDQAYADKLFAPFQRLHTDREFPGTGIGLATVARVVRRHGGSIAASGQVGHGATIRFTFSPTATLEPRP